MPALYIKYMNNTFLKLDDECKNILQEISALSGYSQIIIKEVMEYFLIDWALKIADKPDDYAELSIPFIGKIKVKYLGDKKEDNDTISTEVDAVLELSTSFKKLIGDLHDEGRTEIDKALQRKIDTAVLIASTE